MALDSYTSAINQQFAGPGTSPAEAAGFVAGGVVRPAGPYDFAQGSPLVTGEAIHQAFHLKPTYELSGALTAQVSIGYGSVGGSGNVASYWGDVEMPQFNPHLGSLAAPIPPAFPTHNGGDAANATRIGVVGGTLTRSDGDGVASFGWFDPRQSVGFVFTPPKAPNTVPEMTPVIPDGMNGSPPTSLLFVPTKTLPVQGIGVWERFDKLSVEGISANLPALAGTTARVTSLSALWPRDSTLSMQAGIAHLAQSGATLAPVAFGSSPGLTASPQGLLATSTIFGQVMTVAGAGAAFVTGPYDAEARFAYSCYGASGVASPRSACTAGSYWYGKLKRGFGTFDLALEATRFEPTFAPAMLTYGTTENVWDASFAWPRGWFPNAYSFVDTSQVGPNRQGFRLTTNFLYAGVEVKVSAATFAQV